MRYVYTGSSRIFRGMELVPEDALSKLPQALINAHIAGGVIKQKREDDDGGRKKNKPRTKKLQG